MKERPISELSKTIKDEIIFIYRIGGDGPIDDIWAGQYCDDEESDFHGEWVNPDASQYSLCEIRANFNLFIIPKPHQEEGK